MLPCAAEALVRGEPPALARILDRALEGRELTREEGVALAEAGPEAVGPLAAVADEVRRGSVGDIVTYVVNRNINFTNVCVITLEEIAARAAEAWRLGATEVCVQGGLPRAMDGFHYRDILRAVRQAAPGMHIHAFSPMEVIYGAEKTGMPLSDYLAMLRDEGLGSLPGTAAEILDDGVRRLLSHAKIAVEQWVDVITAAHRLGIPTTSTMMYGHVEEPAHWINQLCLLRDIQKETGGFTDFVPLGFIHRNTQVFEEGKSRPGPSLEEHLKVHALARLLLRGRIDHIQVSWVKLGREVSQRCLQAGADDYGGTLMEENISRLAGAAEGECLSSEEIRARIREAGRIPAERSTTYQLLKVFSATDAN
jgi:FO synthase